MTTQPPLPSGSDVPFADTAEATGTALTSESVMRRALELAARGPRGANPLVGAVIVDSHGQILGEGWHHGAGTPHAEPTALADARRRGSDLTDATMYVTLEPCSHIGRTGPCTEAILAAGIRQVVFAASDTTDKAAGGACYLESKGVRVSGGLLCEESESLNTRWSLAMKQGRPFVTAKFATSLDFALAAADGTSQWITSEASRNHAQTLRATADAVLVGTGTVFADNPALTARTPDGTLLPKQPLRVAMGLRDIPADAAVIGSDDRFRHIRTRDPLKALAVLAEEGAGHIMVEGGPSVLGAFLDADAVDELWHYQAPILLPGGKPASERAPLPTLSAAQRFSLDEAVRLGPDIFLRYSPVRSSEAGDSTMSHERGIRVHRNHH